MEQTRNLRKAINHFESAGIPFGLSDLAQEIGVEVSRVELLMSQGRLSHLINPQIVPRAHVNGRRYCRMRRPMGRMNVQF